MRDAFDFTNQEHIFKIIERFPRQAQILMFMLQHVCNCCDFIQSYAKDTKFCTRSLPVSNFYGRPKLGVFREANVEEF